MTIPRAEPDRADRLVEGFRSKATRFPAYQALVRLGRAALPALRRGLRDEDADVRRWSAMCLDQVADRESLRALVPLLRDTAAGVRLWAVHSLACDHCKDDVSCPVDAVPLLLERAREDESIRVRRMAVIMLGRDFLDERARGVFEDILAAEPDRRLRLHARRGLDRLDRVRRLA